MALPLAQEAERLRDFGKHIEEDLEG